MGKLLAVDIKRLLNNKKTILFVLIAPLLLAALIAFAVAPYFYADVRAEVFSVAIWNEDNDALTIAILENLIESESLGGLISTELVASETEGMDAVCSGAAAYIHVPAGLQDALRSGGTATISYYGNADMPLEDALLYETLCSGTSLVSHAQHAVNVLYESALRAGVDKGDAVDMYNQTTAVFFSEVLSRDALYEQTEEVSPLGDALPVQYYAACLLVLFVALGALPIARITADDAHTGLVHRQLLSGHSAQTCFISRWLAGGAFLLMQYAVLCVVLIAISGGLSGFFGNVGLLLIGGVLLCLLVSLAAMVSGLFVRTTALAAPVMFVCALALSLLGGLFVPSAYMPAFVRSVSHYTPFAAAMRLSISGMFGGGNAAAQIVVITVYIAAALSIGIYAFSRRTR